MEVAARRTSWAYFYFLEDESQNKSARRRANMHGAGARRNDRRLGAPSADPSGELIVFECRDQEEAEATVANAPFQVAQLLDHWRLKPWERVDRVGPHTGPSRGGSGRTIEPPFASCSGATFPGRWRDQCSFV